jgi:hypothetical protein
MKTIDLVDELNEKYFDEQEVTPFRYGYDNGDEIVYFYDYPLWSSCNDAEHVFENQGSLRDRLYDLFVSHLKRITAVSPGALFYEY